MKSYRFDDLKYNMAIFGSGCSNSSIEVFSSRISVRIFVRHLYRCSEISNVTRLKMFFYNEFKRQVMHSGLIAFPDKLSHKINVRVQ